MNPLDDDLVSDELECLHERVRETDEGWVCRECGELVEEDDDLLECCGGFRKHASNCAFG